jgi:hypothetical protein
MEDADIETIKTLTGNGVSETFEYFKKYVPTFERTNPT